MRPRLTARAAITRHWPEYLMEAAELAAFMMSACTFSVLLFHPDSPAVDAVAAPWQRRVLMGLAMAATGAAIVYSPWGQQSGAHVNPAVTLTFWRLRRVATWDATFYAVAQFVGGIGGVAISSLVGRRWLEESAVRFATTTPGNAGVIAAWFTELGLAFVLMTTVLVASNTLSLARFTGLFSAALVAVYIPLAAPVSGMSMNPARSFASAIPSSVWTSLWIYFTAPPLAMLMAAECFIRLRGAQAVFCAKLHHDNDRRCIFCESRGDSFPVTTTIGPERNRRPTHASNKTTA